MSEARDIQRSKLRAMADYVAEARAAFLDEDVYRWREAMENLMGVVGSEVESYGGVVPSYKTLLQSEIARLRRGTL